MILYFDTSAIVPLMIVETSSRICRGLWQRADRVVTSRLTYVEAASALSAALRRARLTQDQFVEARERLDLAWQMMSVLEFDSTLMHAAAAISERCGLRGYDAVQCASALQLLDDDVIGVTGDQELLVAWKQLGMAAVDVNQDEA